MEDSSDDENFMMADKDSDISFGGSDDENGVVVVEPVKKKKGPAAISKKAPAKKASRPKPSNKDGVLSPSKLVVQGQTASSSSDEPTASNKKGKKKTVEEKYQKKSQLEHILLRPDTYIGSIEPTRAPMYVLDASTGQPHTICQKEITFTPGLYKIFDEIVVNAADNKQRDHNMDRLEITVDAARNRITVKNNGEGIPVEFHQKEQMYVPTLIFGHLLTGSNFDDSEKKTTGGRNGYGAKLANVFSTEFVVECLDTNNKAKFRQVFRNNMSIEEKPVISTPTAKEIKGGDYVQISFSPDLARFKMDSLDDDTVALMSKRAYDIAGTMGNSKGKKLQVWLNGEKLPIKSFKDYIGCVSSVEKPVAYACDDRWEVAVAPSPEGTPTQISFVNSIATYKGGAHVTYITDQVSAHLMKVLNKKNKGGSEVKKGLIINHLAIFVNCLIENPAFDSQTKDFMTTAKKNFGSTFDVSPDFLKKVEKSDISKNILAYSNFRDKQALSRKGGTKKVKLTGIPKLDDANFAGSAKSKDCTLIITEGDSAKSLAVAGLSVVGRDYYGVFPLKGKPLNVRDENQNKAASNAEISNLVNILGLKYNMTYDESNIKLLRYGHLLIMADQDVDGSHIKGLIINFIHTFWPSLLDVPGFLQQFITPIVKITKGSRSQSFFTLPEYEQWLESTGNGGRGYTIKYYKGLGTSTSAEAKEYFSNLDTHQITFGRLSDDVVDVSTMDVDDDNVLAVPDKVESGSDLIDMCFRKDRVEDRKQWLLSCPKDIFLDYSTIPEDGLKYSDFINREYIQFSKYDNDRSIPHLLDGFKTSQRKVLFGCFKRKLNKNEIKVAQLTGYIAEHSAYHHGEQSLQGTIVNMAQDFVGSNNINLLTPSGQFGTRRLGGKDAASARYIFTKLEPITRTIFHPDDDDLLTYLTDDGASIEPEFYIPVIPMCLVNGAEGIGTGWSSTVLNYNPREIIANLRRKMAGEPLEPLTPYYSGFVGTIIAEKADKFICSGKIERLDDTTLLISELPVKKWTQTQKELLEAMLIGDAKKPAEIKDFKENHTEATVSFTVTADKENIDMWEADKKVKGLEGKFKLSSSLSASNMTLFDEECRIAKYADPNDILNAFYAIRLEYYDKRKANLIRILEAETMKLSNKARFVEEVCNGQLVVSNRKRKDILEELKSRGFDLISKEDKKEKKTEEEDEEGTESVADEEASTGELAKGYEYLLGMAIWSLTFEKAEQLRKQLKEKVSELETLQATAPTDIWLSDLEAVELALDERDAGIKKSASDELRAQNKNRNHQAKKKAARKKTMACRKKKKDDWDSDMEEDSDISMDIDTEDADAIKVLKKPAAKKPVAKKPAAKVVSKKAPTTAKLAPKSKTATAMTQSQAAKRQPPLETIKDSDDDSDLETDLTTRMAKKKNVSQSLADLDSRRTFDGKPPPPRCFEGSDEDDFLAERLEPRQEPHSLSAGHKTSGKLDDLDFADSEEEVVVAPKPKRKAPATKKQAAVGRKKRASSSEDEDAIVDLLSSDDEPVQPMATHARSSRRAASSKPTNYKYAGNSDDDDDSDFD